MEIHREEVVSKFRPLLMVFAVYAMVCFMLPYLDFGMPRNLRGNMFYFLLTIGLLAFSVVVAVYYKAFKDLQLQMHQQFYLGLTRHLGEDIGFLKEVPDYDSHLAGDMWGLAYNHFEARNLMQGKYEKSVFSAVQATVEQRFMDTLRSDKVLFDGIIVSFELSKADYPDSLIIGKSHPSYEQLETQGKALIDDDHLELAPRYHFLAGEDWMPDSTFIRTLMELDEALRLHRLLRKELIVVIRNGVLTIAIPVYDRLWELVNWKPYESEQFLSRQLLPLTGALKLSKSL